MKSLTSASSPSLVPCGEIGVSDGLGVALAYQPAPRSVGVSMSDASGAGAGADVRVVTAGPCGLPSAEKWTQASAIVPATKVEIQPPTTSPGSTARARSRK